VASPSSEMILDFIQRAQLKAGDQLPAEIDMAKELGLSRATIREAYAKLSTQGLLVRRHGVGTFVARAPVENDFGHRRAFWRMIEAAGFSPSLAVLDETDTALDADLSAQMDLAPGTTVRHLVWLFSADDRPVVLIHHFLAPGLRTNFDMAAHRNILAALADQLDPEGAELESWTTAVNADPEVALLLGVPQGMALLSGFARVHTRDGRIPVISRHWSNPALISVGQRQSLTKVQFEP